MTTPRNVDLRLAAARDHLSPEICFDSKDPLTFLSWVKGIIATYQMED